MNYSELAQPWLEWEAELRAEDEYNCYINGQNDALTLLKPKEPKNHCYMMGWEETRNKTGEIKPELINSNDSIYTSDEEF